MYRTAGQIYVQSIARSIPQICCSYQKIYKMGNPYTLSINAGDISYVLNELGDRQKLQENYKDEDVDALLEQDCGT